MSEYQGQWRYCETQAVKVYAHSLQILALLELHIEGGLFKDLLESLFILLVAFSRLRTGG